MKTNLFRLVPHERRQDREGLEEMSRLVKRLGKDDVDNEDAAKHEADQHAWDGDDQEYPLLHLEWRVRVERRTGPHLPVHLSWAL